MLDRMQIHHRDFPQPLDRNLCGHKMAALRPAPRRSLPITAASTTDPALRPLAPTDTSKTVIAKRKASATENLPVPMIYRPATTSSTTSLAPSNHASTSAPPSGTAGAMGHHTTGPRPAHAAAFPQPAAAGAAGTASTSTFSRSMMVAGFEDVPERQLTTNYSYSWAEDDYSKTQRTIDTWSFVLTLRARLWLLEQKWSYPGGQTPEKRSTRARALAAWLRESILNLGPTYIKLGQLSSTRSDLFPAEFVEELSKLQDRVPSFSADKAIALVEKELGAPISQLYAEFDPVPIAAASLGQVHLARLNSGERVVVKVQRPGLKRLFDLDLENLKLVAAQLDKGDDGAGVRDFTGIYNECAAVLYQEIDYIGEGRNADRFRRNFRAQPWVRVPRVHWQRTSARVLTMEYLPGVKITDTGAILAAGLDAKTIAQRSTEAYLIQILKHGFYHADPHPGNIAIDASGSLIFYDFGMMGTIPSDVKDRLFDTFTAIARKDVDSVLTQLIALGVIAPAAGGDTLSIRRALSYFVDNIGQQAQQQATVANIGEDLFALAIDSPFRFPAAFTFVLRAFATLEGIGKALDPDFSFAATAGPYAQELLDLQDAGTASFVLDQLRDRATEVGQAAAEMPMRLRRVESTISQLQSGDLKLRVRDLEGERAARRAGIMQVATLNAVASVGLLNVGTQLALSGRSVPAGGLMSLAGVFAVLVLLGMRRVKRLDKFEDAIKGRGKFPSS